jgi:hypothetical protein
MDPRTVVKGRALLCANQHQRRALELGLSDGILSDDFPQPLRVLSMNRFHPTRMTTPEFPGLRNNSAACGDLRFASLAAHPGEFRARALGQNETREPARIYFEEVFFSVLLRSLAIVKCCSRIGSVFDANCLMFGSEPLFASLLNSLTSCL